MPVYNKRRGLELKKKKICRFYPILYRFNAVYMFRAAVPRQLKSHCKLRRRHPDPVTRARILR